MPTYAKYRHGSPLMVDHTPGADVAAGDVVVVGVQLRIAHSDIPANTQGALASGGGVYLMPKTAGSTTAIADGATVYWDATNHVITTTASGNKKLGTTIGASVDADTTQLVQHTPN